MQVQEQQLQTMNQQINQGARMNTIRAHQHQVGGENWFSVESALRVYGMYLELDSDQNGMLDREEL